MNREIKERRMWRGETKQKEVRVVLKHICVFCDTLPIERLRPASLQVQPFLFQADHLQLMFEVSFLCFL